jgi:cobalt-zinc-cadmium efflux system protein
MEKQHSHSHSHFGDLTKQTTTRIAISLFLTLAFVGFEAIAGIWGNSLALLSDAGHNITDVIALGLSWYAIRISTQPANDNKTFGYHRAGILTALLNSTTLVFVAGYIFYEAYQRFKSPTEVNSEILIGVGVVAFLINAGTAWLVQRGSEHDLNLRSAFVHLMGDVFSTIGAVIAGVVIAFTGMNWLDPLVSVLIGVLILWNAWGILKETVDILLESTPGDVDTNELVERVMKVEGVKGIHDLHIWSITLSLRALSAHILTDDISISTGENIQKEINEIISHQYNIGHATLQLECVGCEPDLLHCDIVESNHHEHVDEGLAR